MQHVYVLGYPGAYGGASTELLHTIRLWRAHGLGVTLIPTWGEGDPYWRSVMDDLGVRTVKAIAGKLEAVEGLRGGIVVSFCNDQFLLHGDELKTLGCRRVFANCMTWLFDREKALYHRIGLFDAYMFQSDFQRQCLEKGLKKWGYKENDPRGHLIRGAFDLSLFPYSPRHHAPGEAFVLGRIARDDLDKWSSNLWPIYNRIQYEPKRYRVMAWSDRLLRKLGKPPECADCLAANAETAREFLSKLHLLLPVNGGAAENWPRAGLEALSAGVPVVAQKQWGWCEMIDHGRTGFLGANDAELAHYAAMLAHDERLRLEITANAREDLETRLANPGVIWEGWRNLFASIS